MTIFKCNDVVCGCEREGHSMTFCCNCMVTDMTKCPASLPVDEKPKVSYQSVAKEIAMLVAEKQLQYGDSFGKADQVMKVLYPNGVDSSQLRDALIVIRIVDKLFRVANNNRGNEDAFQDIMGYSLLATTRNRRNLS